MKRLSGFFFAALLLCACDKPECRNENPVFEQHACDSQPYIEELARLTAQVPAEKLRYWLKAYHETQGREWLELEVQGPGICACAQVEVADWQHLEGLRSVRGQSYVGAELRDVVLAAIRKEGQLQLVCQQVGYVLD